MWFIRKPSIIGTRLSISRLWYSWWFGRRRILLFQNLHLSLFVCSVLDITKERDKFRNIVLVLTSFRPELRRTDYQCSFWFQVIYYHIGTVTRQYSLWFIRERGVIGTKPLISHLWPSWWYFRTNKFLFSNMRLGSHGFQLILWFSGVETFLVIKPQT